VSSQIVSYHTIPYLPLLPERHPRVTYVYQPGVHVEGKALSYELPKLCVLVQFGTSICRHEGKRRKENRVGGRAKGDETR
jgi:hypothetical protein